MRADRRLPSFARLGRARRPSLHDHKNRESRGDVELIPPGQNLGLRPVVTFSSKSLAGSLRADLCSGSGLTANRINQSNASGLYPAFDTGSCSPRQALSYRPLLALPDLPRGCLSDFALAP